jgi:hypothetical protein
MTMTRSVLAALLVAVVLPAQAAEASAPKLAEYDKLVADWTAAKKANEDAMKALRATEEFKAAVEAKDRQKLTELSKTVALPDAKAFGTRAIELADKYKGDETLRVLAYATANFGDKDTMKAVAERVEKDHIKSPALGDVLENARALTGALGVEGASKLLDRVIAENTHALPKAWAKYWQGQSQQQNARRMQSTLSRPEKKDATDEDKAKAKVEKEKAAEEMPKAQAAADKLFAEAAALAAGTPHIDRIGAPVFEKERLQVGMQVPDIVGEDVDGVVFKLSEYRGKVVLIDFWGFW